MIDTLPKRSPVVDRWTKEVIERGCKRRGWDAPVWNLDETFEMKMEGTRLGSVRVLHGNNCWDSFPRRNSIVGRLFGRLGMKLRTLLFMLMEKNNG